ncbi:Maintenance of ploidy protein mob2 [Saitoella coloradoensis]
MSNFFRSMGRRAGKKTQQQQQQQQQQAPPPPVPSIPQQQQQRQVQQQQQQVEEPEPLFMKQPFARSAIVKGSFKTITALPKYVDPNEWLALNLFEFFQHLSQFWDLISPSCTPNTCPTTHPTQPPSPQNPPANIYIPSLLTHLSSLLSSPSHFPTRHAHPFPRNFGQIAREVYAQMWLVFEHVYWRHFEVVVDGGAEAHWNSLFAHFVTFGREFGMGAEQGGAGGGGGRMGGLIRKFVEQGSVIAVGEQK